MKKILMQLMAIAGGLSLVFPLDCPSAQIPEEWGPRYSTPGIELIVQELQRRAAPQAGPAITYRFRISGLTKAAKDKRFWLVFRDLQTKKPLVAHRNLSIDESGRLVKRDGTDAELGVGQYLDGEPFELAVISTDEEITAFAKVIPFPIDAREGRCHLSGELVTPDGYIFVMSSEGFEPEENLRLVSSSNGDRLEHETKAFPDGTYREFFRPRVEGKDGGSCTYEVIAKSCRLRVEFRWGRR